MLVSFANANFPESKSQNREKRLLTFIFYVALAYNKYVPISRDVGNEATYKKVSPEDKNFCH